MQKKLKIALGLSLLTGIMTGCSTTTPKTEHSMQNGHHTTVYLVNAQGSAAAIGEINFSDTTQGLKIETQLRDLPPGPHGFHIHENASCAPAEKDGKMGAALAAGSHYNPHQAPQHGTPMTGHLGDLPLLLVDNNGTAHQTLYAPRLKMADLHGRTIMIHAGGDNYADTPKPLGGGGDRIACGVL